jgi:hypothetical protein
MRTGLLNLQDADDEQDAPKQSQSPYTKWWILWWYSYLSALQSLLWMTWSSVPDISKGAQR